MEPELPKNPELPRAPKGDDGEFPALTLLDMTLAYQVKVLSRFHVRLLNRVFDGSSNSDWHPDLLISARRDQHIRNRYFAPIEQ